MPHLFVNRPRLHDLTSAHPGPSDHFRWESINAVLYKVGGVVFMIGSVLFFPRYEAYADLGAGVFFFGSLLYLVVTGHDMAEVWRYWRDKRGNTRGRTLEFTAAVAYLSGTLLFTVGSVFFISAVGWIVAGGWCFVIGSLLFLLGATVNVLQIVQARTLVTLQLMNLTAVSFVAGSILFAVASVPYLWTVESPTDRYTLFTFLAWQYLTGSALFFLGGVFNYCRAYVTMRGESQSAQAN
jgi:hypothetical protein